MSTGLLVMAYGSPGSPGDIASYYTHIRRGRPPTDEQLANLVHRYEAIGGTTGLARRTAEQLRGIEQALADVAGSTSPTGEHGEWIVALGTKHSSPSIADGAGSLIGSGVERIIGLVLAPHYSAVSVGEYHRQAAAAVGATATEVPYQRIDHWHTLDAWIGFQAARVGECLAVLPERTEVLFTAHSLPERVLTDDPYPDQLHESAAAIAQRADPPPGVGWRIGWQSAGATPEPWRGPDLCEEIAALADAGRHEGILVVPQGFTSDHLEVLYDIDIEAATAARRVGLAFARTPTVNDDPSVMTALAALVGSVATGSAGSGAGSGGSGSGG